MREAGEAKEMLVHRVAILVIASFAKERGAGFVEHASEHGVAAEADTRTARGTLSEVGSSGGVHIDGGLIWMLAESGGVKGCECPGKFPA